MKFDKKFLCFLCSIVTGNTYHTLSIRKAYLSTSIPRSPSDSEDDIPCGQRPIENDRSYVEQKHTDCSSFILKGNASITEETHSEEDELSTQDMNSIPYSFVVGRENVKHIEIDDEETLSPYTMMGPNTAFELV